MCVYVYIISTEDLPVSSDPSDTEKSDMRIVQAAAQEVCGYVVCVCVIYVHVL